ncbi:TetR/AcrR family transcriptional repressor of nem operon [Kitasatospora sp. GP30]|uniref:TetR/AcrR family transcriptional regulator n=1 Tax=Kitasatospora sp. GP30 TaxID=3035084 RepID=UPI000C6FEBC8|nr:helix-turn-helix domain-containing protein [Kitasatospora sp. GP30]MDH6141554.1 TetR/AcrR family transcriptional repressor of nem operon [Kitasatospora sp. GP30]
MPDIKHFDPELALERAEKLFWQRGAAEASIQDVVAATGLNRSSLYATFGGKQQLYLAAIRRYLHHRAQPAFRHLADDDRGLPAVRDFFAGLIEVRCSGEHAGWGCMVVNAHLGGEHQDPAVLALLAEHHRQLRDALHTALRTARRAGQLAPHVAPDTAAETLALLAYGVNLHSRTGADAPTLLRTVTGTLALLEP